MKKVVKKLKEVFQKKERIDQCDKRVNTGASDKEENYHLGGQKHGFERTDSLQLAAWV